MRAQEGWERRMGGGTKWTVCVRVCVRVDLAMVMEWHFERGRYGGKGEEFATLWSEAGVRWSVTCFFFYSPPPAAVRKGAEVWAELQRPGKVCRKGRRWRGNWEVKTWQYIPHLYWLLIPLTDNVTTWPSLSVTNWPKLDSVAFLQTPPFFFFSCESFLAFPFPQWC